MRKSNRILVTGGAGFIGSFLVDKLIDQGYEVTIFDNLDEQVHQGIKPKYLNKSAIFTKSDVRDYDKLKKAIKNTDIIFHLASSVGVGQSNYEIKKYTDINIAGTANLLQILVDAKNKLHKLVTVSSMTGLGEGLYNCSFCGFVRPGLREEKQLRKHQWEMLCPNCGKLIIPISTNEEAEEFPNSVYAISKKCQQDMSFLVGKMYQIPTTVLRLFNVYGPRQSLSNPYTGVTAIFISRIKNNQEIKVYEDGMQSRDFISVHDVVDALVSTVDNQKSNYEMINIGSGRPIAIGEVARKIAKHFNKENLVQISLEYRKNDIRHCFADITKAKKLLGWKPKITFDQGLNELIKWSSEQIANDKFSIAEKELKSKGIL